VTVLRGNGSQHEIKGEELVVGDILLLEVGDFVPADCVLIEDMNM